MKLFPEVNHHVQGESYKILVGTKVDLREDPQCSEELQRTKSRPAVTTEEGEKLAHEIGAYYVETSSVTGLNMDELVKLIIGGVPDPVLLRVGPAPVIPKRPECPIVVPATRNSQITTMFRRLGEVCKKIRSKIES